jgi:hypothetical protein
MKLNIKLVKLYQNYIQTISKLYSNYIKIIFKLYSK